MTGKQESRMQELAKVSRANVMDPDPDMSVDGLCELIALHDRSLTDPKFSKADGLRRLELMEECYGESVDLVLATQPPARPDYLQVVPDEPA